MITSTIINQEKRWSFIPSITKQYIHFEQALYHFFSLYCKEYQGGYWEFVELSNGGKYIYPTGQDLWLIKSNSNQAEHKLTAKAAGVLITLVTLSYYSMQAWNREDTKELEKLAILEHQLYLYAKQLKEAPQILDLLGEGGDDVISS